MFLMCCCAAVCLFVVSVVSFVEDAVKRVVATWGRYSAALSGNFPSLNQQ